MKTLIRRLIVFLGASLFSFGGTGIYGAVIPVDLLTGHKYTADKDVGTIALVQAIPDGQGLSIAADYMFGGTWVQHTVKIPPIPAALKKITVTARGGGAKMFVGIRCSSKLTIFYELIALPAIADEPKTYEFDATHVSLTKKSFVDIEYPIVSVVFTLKQLEAKNAILEVKSMSLEAGD